MKPSKVLHAGSLLVGFVGVSLFAGAMNASSSEMVYGMTKMDALMSIAILLMVAIWGQVATIHHMMLEKKGEWF